MLNIFLFISFYYSTRNYAKWRSCERTLRNFLASGYIYLCLIIPLTRWCVYMSVQKKNKTKSSDKLFMFNLNKICLLWLVVCSSRLSISFFLLLNLLNQVFIDFDDAICFIICVCVFLMMPFPWKIHFS